MGGPSGHAKGPPLTIDRRARKEKEGNKAQRSRLSCSHSQSLSLYVICKEPGSKVCISHAYSPKKLPAPSCLPAFLTTRLAKPIPRAALPSGSNLRLSCAAIACSRSHAAGLLLEAHPPAPRQPGTTSFQAPRAPRARAATRPPVARTQARQQQQQQQQQQRVKTGGHWLHKRWFL